MANASPNRSSPASSGLLSHLFHGGILLKGIDGAIELVGGLALLILGPGRIINLVRRLTQHEISPDNHDFIATHLRHAAAHLSLSGERFMAVYIFLHGIVKLIIVLALMRGKLWAYPVGIVVFGAFVIYQVYRYTLTHSVGLLLLASIDLIVITLIALEYRSARAASRQPEPQPQHA